MPANDYGIGKYPWKSIYRKLTNCSGIGTGDALLKISQVLVHDDMKKRYGKITTKNRKHNNSEMVCDSDFLFMQGIVTCSTRLRADIEIPMRT